MASSSIVPSDWRTHIALDLVEDISTSPENTFYMFVGDHMPQNTVGTISDDVNDMLVSAFRNMIAAKVVKTTDVSMMIVNIPWAANTAYAMYDDSDPLLSTENFYAIVNAGAFSHVWKCLDNNMGSLSTAAPDISQITVSDISYRTSDGYMWKYMASSASANVAKFGTDLFFPIVANTQVTSAAIAGTIDMINVDVTGSGYHNYLSGTWGAADIRANGNTQTYAVTGNSISSTVNGFYTGCNIYIAGGTGIGQFKTIIDYFSNANGNFVVVDSVFTTPPQNGSQYQINPGVVITGTSRQAINAAARALVNAVGNTVYRVDILNRGAGYTFLSATVTANAVATPTQAATVRPIYSPYGGHGFDAYGELNATRVGISVSIANNEANTIPATNVYQQVGLLKDPVFANVIINFSTLVGSFLSNEQVVTYSSRLLQNNVIITAASANVSVTAGVLASQVTSGDRVLFTTGTQAWMTTVNVVSNNTFMTISTTPPWACTTAQMFLATILPGLGTVLSLPGANSVGLTSVTGTFPTSTTAIGLSSGAFGTVNNVTRNAVIKSFDTFVPLHKFTATLVSGTFLQNEILFMGTANNMTSTAAIHSVYNNSGTLTIYTSNTVGAFTESVTQQVQGANSGAIATLTAAYNAEIAFGSSKVMYLEDIAPVTRSNTTTDVISVILEF